MREESQLDEMRAAIRGDFGRLAERRGEQELMRLPEKTDEPETAPEKRADGAPRRSWLIRLVSPWGGDRQV